MAKRNLITFLILLLMITSCLADSNTWSQCTNLSGFEIAISPSNPQIIYITGGSFFGDWSKLYRSTDCGYTWSFVTSFGTQLGSVVIDPYSSHTIYLGVGGLQILKSTDECSSFYSSSSGLSSSSGYPIVIDPINSNRLYCGGWFSKSVDYGQSWILSTTGNNNIVRDIAIDPNTQQNLYCSTDNLVYKSTDTGMTWTIITTGLPNGGGIYYGIGMDPIYPNILYLSSHSSPYFFKSYDGGNLWIEMDNGLSGLPLRGLLVDPSNSSTIYVATDFDGVYRSFDAGSTWSNFNGSGSTQGKIIYNLAMSLSSTTTLFAVGEGIHCYSFGEPTGVQPSLWQQLDSKKPDESQSTLKPSSFAYQNTP